MSEVVVRRAIPEDMAGILRIAAGSDKLPHWSERDYCKLLHPEAELPLQRVLLVARAGGSVVGFAVASVLRGGLPVEAEVELIAVDRGARRRGIGRALLAALLEAIAGFGTDVVRLEVRALNAPAIALYRDAGFQDGGLRKGYYTLPADDARRMELVFAAGVFPAAVFPAG